MEMVLAVDLEEKIKEIAGRPWSPVEVAHVNDQVVRLALFEGEYHWHKHTSEDELFYVIEGRIVLQLKDQPDITLSKGKLAVVPRGVEHCPKSIEPSYVLMFELAKLKSEGD